MGNKQYDVLNHARTDISAAAEAVESASISARNNSPEETKQGIEEAEEKLEKALDRIRTVQKEL